RAVVQVDVGERRQFQVENESVGPVCANKECVLGHRCLLFLRVPADVPERRSQEGSGRAVPLGEPCAPILAREGRLVQVVLQPEGHLGFGRIGQPCGHVVLKVGGGARPQGGGRRGRKTACSLS